jgi:exodeoxyribonuclease VII small subunit
MLFLYAIICCKSWFYGLSLSKTKGYNMADEKLSFEEAYKQLTELVQKMESGEMPLADSVAAYEQCIKLKAYCEQLLKEAELKIETLKVTNAGE